MLFLRCWHSSYLKKKQESDPLIIFDVLLVLLVPGFVHPRVGHVHAHPLPVGGAEGVGGVDPAVGVEHLLGHVARVHAHYRRAHVLRVLLSDAHLKTNELKK